MWMSRAAVSIAFTVITSTVVTPTTSMVEGVQATVRSEAGGLERGGRGNHEVAGVCVFLGVGASVSGVVVADDESKGVLCTFALT